jgi:hypothetical protein
MELLDSTILLFKRKASDKVLKELDQYFKDVLIIRDELSVELTDKSLDLINDFIQKNVKNDVLNYFVELNHPDRPDLKAYSAVAHIDLEHYKKTKEFRSLLKLSNNFKLESGNAVLTHRGTVIYDGNLLRWKGTLNKFTVLIGLSEEHEHVSYIKFPIQGVSVQLNRGDILIAPAGITHPFTVTDIINGKFKFIDCL